MRHPVAKIVSVNQMVAIEKKADASGLSYDRMMENAGIAVAERILSVWPKASGFKILVLVGPGNNGGDGLVAGFHLANAGADVSYYLLKERAADDRNLVRVQEMSAQIIVAEDDARDKKLNKLIDSTDLIIDGLLGTGFKLPLHGTAKSLLARVQKRICERDRPVFVVAIDCPSGVDCDSGDSATECIQADITITLAAVKEGLLKPPGAELVGDLYVGDIGLSADNTELMEISREMMDWERARSWLPTRDRYAHKGTFGQVLIIAGSINYPGAAVLAAKGAYRAGAGLVTLAIPEPIYQPLVAVIPEATWIILPHIQGAIASGAVEVLAESIPEAQSCLIGPGFSQDRSTEQFMRKLFMGKEAGEGLGFVESPQSSSDVQFPPVVFDADGLKLLAKLEQWQNLIPAQSILTPHPGEMSVLSSLSIEEIQKDRIGAAEHWAKEWGHIVVLKGAYTVVAGPGGESMVIPIATPALASAGTGDVLAGIIASLLGQGLAPFKAAALGAYLHGRAGVLAAEVYQTSTSVIAGDVADALPEVFAELELGPPT
jgi:hydroxyethylthiazole kinase-like uncharacterized protein yjeF